MDVTVSLDDGLAGFVQDEVSAGRFGAPGDVLREALRLMRDAERDEADRLQALREAWQDGIDSGDAGELDLVALKEEARARPPAART